MAATRLLSIFSGRHLVVRIVMETKMPDLMGNDDKRVDGVLIFGNVHKP
jgi:hypothetical protein